MAIAEKKTTTMRRKKAMPAKTAKQAERVSHDAPSPPMATDDNTRRKPIWEIAVELGAQIPDEEWAKWPSDGSINYKHYLYGTPKVDE